MEEQLYDAGMGVIQYISSLDFTTGALYYLVIAVLGAVVCFWGYKFSEAVLTVIGFAVGFAFAGWALPAVGASPQPRTLLGVEILFGILFALLAFKVVEFGVFLAAYGFASQILVPLILPAVSGFLNDRGIEIALPVLSLMIALLFAYLARKAERWILILLTALIGGFALVNGVHGLLGFLPGEASSAIPELPLLWLGLQILLAAVGFLVQKRDR